MVGGDGGCNLETSSEKRTGKALIRGGGEEGTPEEQERREIVSQEGAIQCPSLYETSPSLQHVCILDPPPPPLPIMVTHISLGQGRGLEGENGQGEERRGTGKVGHALTSQDGGRATVGEVTLIVEGEKKTIVPETRVGVHRQKM